MGFKGYQYTFRLNASHSNTINGQDVHNHTFVMSIYVKQNDGSFEAYDITENAIQNYLKLYSGVVLNNVPPFDIISPTVENIGEEFFVVITQILAKIGYQLAKLEISETPQRVFSISEKDLSIKERTRLDYSISKIEQMTLTAATKEVSKKIEIPKKPVVLEPKKDEVASKDLNIIGTDTSITFKILPASKKAVLISIVLMILAGFVAMNIVRYSGYYPLGLDIHGHLFKTDLIYNEFQNGNFYPIYTQYWYNGLQPFRYWPPMSYYFMALFQAIGGGDVMNAYLGFVWASFTIGGTGWVIFGRKLGRPLLGAFFGIAWFMFPDNLRVFFGEGNLPRMFITMLLPYILYCLWQFVCYRRKKMIIPLSILMLIAVFGHLMISAMIGVASAIFLLIYSIANKRFKESIMAILAMLFSFVVAGIWVYPSLVGGLTSMGSDGTSALMASLSAKLSISLNPFIRLEGGVTELYFGLSIAVIAFAGMFLSNKKSLPGFCAMIIVVMGTTTALTPIIQKIPLSQLFWVRRFAPIAYAMFVIAVLEWRSLKKAILILACLVIIIDAVPSFRLNQYDDKMNIPATIVTIEESMDEYLFAQAKEITKQRVSLMDLSKFGPMPSYAFGTLEQKTQYVFGWAWQGAATATNISTLNESLEKENFLYMFDRSLELGADSVIIYKAEIDDSDWDKLMIAAKSIGYEKVGESNQTILLSLGVESTYGVITEYRGMAIGTTAPLITGIMPYYHTGDKSNIEEYTAKELEAYDKIYLSGIFYKDKETAEELVREIAEAGVEVFIDMSRIPADPLTSKMVFLDIFAQPITFYNRFPELITDTLTIKAVNFADSYEDWNAVYLTGLEKTEGYAWIRDTKLDFAGKDKMDNVTFLGFNLLFHAYTTGDTGVISILSSMMDLNEEELAKRTMVPLDITHETNKITIKSDYDNVNTTLAYQDTFWSEEEISSRNNFLIVNKGTTVITMEYPYLAKGIVVSLLGIMMEVFLFYTIFRKPRIKIKKKKPADIMSST